MRLYFTIALSIAASILTSCAVREANHIEVTPKLCWHIHDYSGESGTANYHDKTNYWATNCFAPFVVLQGTPFTMDFARHDSFISPDSQKNEAYFDGVVARFTVVASNNTACFSGRTDYNLHLGVTSANDEEDESLYGQTLRSYSNRFYGTCTFGHEVGINLGEDINEGPFINFTFRPTSARLSKISSDGLRVR